MMRVLVVLALMAQPAVAECFTGQPHKVTYTGGSVLQVLDRQGDDATHAWVAKDGTLGEAVQARLSLFVTGAMRDGKLYPTRWAARLPTAADLVPGFKFDISGSSPSSSGGTDRLRLEGRVVEGQAVTVGKCAYDTTVIEYTSYLNDDWLYHATLYLRTDMMVFLRNDVQLSGAEADTVALSIE